VVEERRGRRCGEPWIAEGKDIIRGDNKKRKRGGHEESKKGRSPRRIEGFRKAYAIRNVRKTEKLGGTGKIMCPHQKQKIRKTRKE